MDLTGKIMEHHTTSDNINHLCTKLLEFLTERGEAAMVYLTHLECCSDHDGGLNLIQAVLKFDDRHEER